MEVFQTQTTAAYIIAEYDLHRTTTPQPLRLRLNKQTCAGLQLRFAAISLISCSSMRTGSASPYPGGSEEPREENAVMIMPMRINFNVDL
jgi:hypothetical protein